MAVLIISSFFVIAFLVFAAIQAKYTLLVVLRLQRIRTHVGASRNSLVLSKTNPILLSDSSTIKSSVKTLLCACFLKISVLIFGGIFGTIFSLVLSWGNAQVIRYVIGWLLN